MRTRWVFAIVSTGVVLATLDQFIVNVAFESIASGLHGRLSTVSWVLNGYSIVFAALLVPAGRFADRRGRRFGFLLGVAIFTAASAACAGAGNLGELITARAVQAVGAALLVPSSLGLLLAAYPPERRAAAVRGWTAVTGASAALGPALGGLLVTASWRWIFIVNVPIGMLALAAGRRFLPVLPREREPLPDLLGAATLAAGISLLTLALVEGPSWGWGSARTVGSLLGSALAIGVFLRRSATHRSPVVELSLLRLRTFAIAGGAVTIYSVAFASMLLSLTLWTQTGWHWSALRFGLAFVPGPAMVPLFSAIGGRFVRAFGAGGTATIGCAVFAAGMVTWTVALGDTPDYLTGLLPGEVLGGIGVGLTLPTLIGAGSTALPPERFATGSGVLSMARQIGFTLGVAMLVAVLGSRHGLAAFRVAWLVTAGMAAAAAVVSLRLRGSAAARATLPDAVADEAA